MKENIRNILLENDNILITAHKNPDGDAVGAGLALYLSLKALGKKVRFVLQDKIPDTTLFLEGSEEIEQYQAGMDLTASSLIVFVDCATRDRAGIMDNISSKIKTINIDHHLSNPLYGDYSLVSTGSAATSEILASLLQEWKFPINAAVASALYLGIVNDTGNFSHDNVSKETLSLAQALMHYGANPSHIVRNFLHTNSYESLKLLGEALSHFQFFEDKKLVYYFLSREVMEKYQAKKEHTEGIVEKLLSYEKASVSLFLREEEDGSIKGSMRSKYDVDVNHIASLFHGGGHKKAAGFSSKDSVNVIVEKILSEL